MSLCRVCVCLVTLLSWLTGGVALADGAASPSGSAVQRQRGIPDRGSGQQTTLRALAEEGVEWPFRGIGEQGPMAHLRVTPLSPSEVEALAVVRRQDWRVLLGCAELLRNAVLVKGAPYTERALELYRQAEECAPEEAVVYLRHLDALLTEFDCATQRSGEAKADEIRAVVRKARRIDAGNGIYAIIEAEVAEGAGPPRAHELLMAEAVRASFIHTGIKPVLPLAADAAEELGRHGVAVKAALTGQASARLCLAVLNQCFGLKKRAHALERAGQKIDVARLERLVLQLASLTGERPRSSFEEIVYLSLLAGVVEEELTPDTVLGQAETVSAPAMRNRRPGGFLWALEAGIERFSAGAVWAASSEPRRLCDVVRLVDICIYENDVEFFESVGTFSHLMVSVNDDLHLLRKKYPWRVLPAGSSPKQALRRQ